MIVIIYITIALLSLMVLYLVSRSSESARLIDKIPGPTPLPLIGNLLTFNASLEKLWDLVIQILDDYYPRMRLWSFEWNVIFTRNVDDIKAILSCKKNIDKCKKVVYNGIRALDNDGLLVSGGDKWRQRRKLITPSFGLNSLKDYFEIMNEHTKRLIDDIKNRTKEDTVIDAVPVFMKLALGIVCEAAMGVDLSSFGDKEEEKFRHSFGKLSDLILYRASRPYMKDWMMKLLSEGRTREHNIKFFKTFANMIFQTRREYLEKIGYQNLRNIVDDVEDTTTTNEGKKRLAFLDLLITAKTEGLIDEKGVRDEVETFMVAGNETTGISLTFILMLMAENKAVQDLAREEVNQLFERTGGLLKMTDLNGLDYLDRCVKEALRLYPSVPIIGRHVSENTKFQNYEIPQGTEVLMHLYQLHRDPNYWSDPEKFDPDRFLPENTMKRHPFAYQPFSAGPRACIGSKFATLVLKAVVARILYNFYIEPVDLLENVKFKIHVTLRPKDSCRVRLISINRKSTA